VSRCEEWMLVKPCGQEGRHRRVTRDCSEFS
jgi:hypothetical protein